MNASHFLGEDMVKESVLKLQEEQKAMGIKAKMSVPELDEKLLGRMIELLYPYIA